MKRVVAWTNLSYLLTSYFTGLIQDLSLDRLHVVVVLAGGLSYRHTCVYMQVLLVFNAYSLCAF
jgi:hypothetical protein